MVRIWNSKSTSSLSHSKFLWRLSTATCIRINIPVYLWKSGDYVESFGQLRKFAIISTSFHLLSSSTSMISTSLCHYVVHPAISRYFDHSLAQIALRVFKQSTEMRATAIRTETGSFLPFYPLADPTSCENHPLRNHQCIEAKSESKASVQFSFATLSKSETLASIESLHLDLTWN